MVEGCVRNDRYFQELLFRRHFPAMMEMCQRHTTDQELAMQIVNDGFLRVFKKIHLFGFRGSLEGWIRRIVYHSLSDHFRHQHNYIRFLVIDETVATNAHTEPADDLYVDDLLKMVDRLPPSSANVFRLFAIEGYTHEEIARETGISAGTSKWHLNHARQLLRDMIRQIEKSYEKKY
jgi:RNA polymerase sigma-70 factor (ECF subfamily)